MFISKSRSCPRCGAPVSWARLWLKSGIWVNWECPECGAGLRFNAKRRFVVTLVATPALGLGLYSAFGGTYWLAAVSFLLWGWIWSYDAVECRIAPVPSPASEACP